MNNRILLLAFLLLLSIYFISRTCSGKRSGSFDADLIELDTAKVTSVVIKPKEAESPEVLLKREDSGWIASNGTLNTKATGASISGLLNSIQLIKTQRVVAKSSDKWRDFEVDDDQGTRVKVYYGDKKEADFIVGRFNFNPQAQSGASYIRLDGSNEVYAVEGFQLLAIGQGFDSYRNKSLIHMTSDMKVNEIDFEYPGNTYTLRKGDAGWAMDGSVPLDSVKVADYINYLRNMSGTTFADDFDETLAGNLSRQVISIKGEQIDPPFMIQVYRDTTRERPFVIHSNQNPSAWFDSDSSGVYMRLIKALPGDFIHTEN